MRPHRAVLPLLLAAVLACSACQSQGNGPVFNSQPAASINPPASTSGAQVPRSVTPYDPPIEVRGLTTAPAKAPSFLRVCTLQNNTVVSYGATPFHRRDLVVMATMLVCPREPDVWRHSRLWVEVPESAAATLARTITATPSTGINTCRVPAMPVMARSEVVMVSTPNGGWFTVALPSGPGCEPVNPTVEAAIATAINGVPAIRPAG